MKKKKKKKRKRKKKRGPIQLNYIISSWFTTGPETQNKATITKRSNRQQQASSSASATVTTRKQKTEKSGFPRKKP
jgi:hypothetical protein